MDPGEDGSLPTYFKEHCRRLAGGFFGVTNRQKHNVRVRVCVCVRVYVRTWLVLSRNDSIPTTSMYCDTFQLGRLLTQMNL